jgi:hypothetical protein
VETHGPDGLAVARAGVFAAAAIVGASASATSSPFAAASAINKHAGPPSICFGELRCEPDDAFERAGLGDASLTISQATLGDAVVNTVDRSAVIVTPRLHPAARTWRRWHGPSLDLAFAFHALLSVDDFQIGR